MPFGIIQAPFRSGRYVPNLGAEQIAQLQNTPMEFKALDCGQHDHLPVHRQPSAVQEPRSRPSARVDHRCAHVVIDQVNCEIVTHHFTPSDRGTKQSDAVISLKFVYIPKLARAPRCALTRSQMPQTKSRHVV